MTHLLNVLPFLILPFVGAVGFDVLASWPGLSRGRRIVCRAAWLACVLQCFYVIIVN